MECNWFINQNESEPCNRRSIFWNAFKQIKQALYRHHGAYTIHGNHSVMDILLPPILHKNDT
jgi:hypothetical protein